MEGANPRHLMAHHIVSTIEDLAFKYRRDPSVLITGLTVGAIDILKKTAIATKTSYQQTLFNFLENFFIHVDEYEEYVKTEIKKYENLSKKKGKDLFDGIVDILIGKQFPEEKPEKKPRQTVVERKKFIKFMKDMGEQHTFTKGAPYFNIIDDCCPACKSQDIIIKAPEHDKQQAFYECESCGNTWKYKKIKFEE